MHFIIYVHFYQHDFPVWSLCVFPCFHCIFRLKAWISRHDWNSSTDQRNPSPDHPIAPPRRTVRPRGSLPKKKANQQDFDLYRSRPKRKAPATKSSFICGVFTSRSLLFLTFCPCRHFFHAMHCECGERARQTDTLKLIEYNHCTQQSA